MFKHPNQDALDLIIASHTLVGTAMGSTTVNEATVLNFDASKLREQQIQAGLLLARICLGAQGHVALLPAGEDGATMKDRDHIHVAIDHCLEACIGCQYAGWPLSAGKYFAMASGPFRMLRGKEELLKKYNLSTNESVGVGVLETAKQPTEEAVQMVVDETSIDAKDLTLCIARTASLAGMIQIVARSVETAMHKLHEIGFDLRTIRRGAGVAPIPPATDDDLVALGWTNDAILYGAEVELTVESDDSTLEEIINQIPSCSSNEFGQPFLALFNQYDQDFYKIDPMLFSPAKIRLTSSKTGNSFDAGNIAKDILRNSFDAA